MRLRGSLFWGIVLIILAVILLGRQMGYLSGNIFDYFWPAVAILFGIWLLIGAIGRGRRDESQTISIPRENASWARIKFDHGAGRLNIHAGAENPNALTGVFGSEMSYRSKVDGDRVEIRLRNAPGFWAWNPGQSLDWDVSLNKEVLYNLKIDSGASAANLDLTELKVTNLEIDTGASSTEVILPANAGTTNVEVDSGAASVKINVPSGVGATIHIKGGVTAVHVDTNRFHQIDKDVYRSDEYNTSANRADITVSSGLGTVEIK